MAAAPVLEPVLVVNREELVACSLPMWYTLFKKYTINSVFIPLTKEFVDYLLMDGLMLPKECEFPCYNDPSSLDSLDNDGWEDEPNDRDEEEGPSFPDMVLKISDGIRTLQGEVFPKLNWSSPKDATWITPGHTLKCTTPGEIILLLKSSQFIAHDLSVMVKSDSNSVQQSEQTSTDTGLQSCYDVCGHKERGNIECINELVDFEYILCLRKWCNIRLSNEFRCFVWNHHIIGISQRHCDNYYEFLDQDRSQIIQDIIQFQNGNVAGKFPLKDYVVDLYRLSKGVVTIVDFNPFCSVTDNLLFSWEELKGLIENFTDETGPVLKLVSDPTGIQPSTLHTLHVPKDFLDLSTGSDVNKMIDVLSKVLLIAQED